MFFICALGRIIFPYGNSIPFQIVRNKFLTINEKLFASYPQAKQFACSRAQTKNPFGLFFVCALGRNRTYIKALEEPRSIH